MEDLASMLPLALMALILGVIVVVSRRRVAARAAQGAEPLSGVGGWLLLLILGLVFLGPLIGGVRLNADLSAAEVGNPALSSLPQWAIYKTSVWSLVALKSALSVCAGVSLFRSRRQAAVKLAKVVLWVVGPFATVVAGMGIPLVVFGTAPIDPALVGAVFASAIPAVIWHAYLAQSDRVRNTYVQRDEA